MPWIKNPDGSHRFVIEDIPEVLAANYGAATTGNRRGAILHAPVTADRDNAARSVADYFASGQTQGSTQVVVGDDPNELIRCVPDNHVAHGAAGANHSHKHIELAGDPRQTREQWLDAYSRGVIDNGARVCSQWALQDGWPIRRVTTDELRRGVRGYADHDQVSKAFGKSDHWDVGPGFPDDLFHARLVAWHRHFIAQHPGVTDVADDRPYFKVVVFYDPSAPVDEGMARLYAAHDQLAVLPWNPDTVRFGYPIVYGKLQARAAEIQRAGDSKRIKVFAGPDRSATAQQAGTQLREGGYRSLAGVAY